MSRILVVDDNENNVYLVNYILTKGGHHVLIAENGKDAIDIAQREKLDLILMDIQLPDLDGLQVANKIRGFGINDVMIVALTSYAMIGDKETAIKAGFNGYIEKPIEPDSFLKDIDKYLKRNKL